MSTTERPARPLYQEVLPDTYKRLLNLNQHVDRMADEHSVSHLTLELVKIRSSQLNGCAFCTDLHVGRALDLGEQQRRLTLLPVWRETTLFSAEERAALALSEAITLQSQTQDVPDDVHDAAAAVFSEEQLGVVVWAIAVIQTFNVINVTSRKPLP